MGVKRDSVNRKADCVNRQENLVYLPIVLPSSVKRGDKITLYDVKEDEINPDIKDPMEGFKNPDGSPNPDGSVGDVIFDPTAPGAEDTVFDPMK